MKPKLMGYRLAALIALGAVVFVAVKATPAVRTATAGVHVRLHPVYQWRPQVRRVNVCENVSDPGQVGWSATFGPVTVSHLSKWSWLVTNLVINVSNNPPATAEASLR